MCFLFFGCAGSSLLHGLFSSCGEWELLSSCITQVSHCGGRSYCGEQALGHVGSAVAVPRLQSTSSVVVAHGPNCSVAYRIFLTRDWTHVSCIGRQSPGKPSPLHFACAPLDCPAWLWAPGAQCCPLPLGPILRDSHRLLFTKDHLTLLNQESAVCGSEAPLDAMWILTKLPPTLQMPVTWLLFTQMNPWLGSLC